MRVRACARGRENLLPVKQETPNFVPCRRIAHSALPSADCMMYTTYSSYLQRFFPGKVQKLPVNVGASCPVRDGRISRGGCAFCNRTSFAPTVGEGTLTVSEQLEAGKRFFGRKIGKGGTVDFLAYFQSGTNTYASVRTMRPFVEEALRVDGVKGVVLATRPDCVSADWLDYLSDLSKRVYVCVELGVESVNDEVLRRIGRGHCFADSRKAILALSERGISVCAHLILGLPGETRESMLAQAEAMSQLPVDIVKLHQLQILRGARMAGEYARNPEAFNLFTVETYAELVADFIERLSPHIAIERFVSQSPTEELIAPRWGVKNEVVTATIIKVLRERDSFQGKRLAASSIDPTFP